MLEALQRLAPDIPMVSEEIATDRSAPLGARFFLVDPLDGTKEFIQKRSDFTVNIALVENGSPASAWSMRRRGRCSPRRPEPARRSR